MSNLGYPLALVLLAVIPIVAWLAHRARRRAIRPFPSISLAGRFRTTARNRLRWLPAALRLLALVLIVVALARPQRTRGWSSVSTEGVAIQLVLDRSGSMREAMTDSSGAESTKMQVARTVLREFVTGDGANLKGRTGDLIGLIAFSRYADTLAPLSRTHATLADAIARVEPVAVRAEDGTAIGDGIALAAARLKRAEEETRRGAAGTDAKPEFQIKSKVIVLMTDGINNAGMESPYDAAKLAKEWGIRIYAIGVGGGDRTVDFGGQRISIGGELDDRMLSDIASQTGGRYFRASTSGALREAYRAIDELEKSRMDSVQHTQRDERFGGVAIAALAALLVESLLASTLLRRVA